MMLPFWLFATLFANVMQVIRTGLQKSLKTKLSTEAITWARFGFGLPWVIFLIFLVMLTGQEFPALNTSFLRYCFFASLSQIIATILLVSIFSYRNFMIGIAYSNTAAFQTFLFGAVFFNVYLSIGVVIAIFIGLIGVFLISVIEQHIKWQDFFKNITKKSSLIGLGSGAGFALASLYIREASLSLPDTHSTLMKAMTTLLSMLCMQTCLLGGWMFYKNRKVFSDLLIHWKPSLLVGLTGILGSIGWFVALTLTHAAYVKTVSQIELVFSFLMTRFLFKEKITRIEIFGSFFIIMSILLIIWLPK